MNSAIIEVIIGMIFIFSLLSILVTQVNSIIGDVLKLRERHLRAAIIDIVQDKEIRAKILTHPLVRLVKGRIVLPQENLSEDEADAIAAGRLTNVTWIDPEIFVNVLTSVLRSDADQVLFGSFLSVIDSLPSESYRQRLRNIVIQIMNTGEGLDELRQAIEQIPSGYYRDSIVQAHNQLLQQINTLGLDPRSLVTLTASLNKVQNPYFRTTLETILQASRSFKDAEKQLITWFNDSMDRASRSFTQHMRNWSLIVGLVITLLLNVDAVYIAQTLWRDPSVRAVVVEVAQQFDVDSLQPPIDATPNDPQQAPETVEEAFANIAESGQEASETLTQLINLRIPLGWKYEDASPQRDSIAFDLLTQDGTNFWNFLPVNNPNWLVFLASKLVGWAATTIAIAQGAPFWFSLLRRLTGKE